MYSRKGLSRFSRRNESSVLTSQCEHRRRDATAAILPSRPGRPSRRAARPICPGYVCMYIHSICPWLQPGLLYGRASAHQVCSRRGWFWEGRAKALNKARAQNSAPRRAVRDFSSIFLCVRFAVGETVCSVSPHLDVYMCILRKICVCVFYCCGFGTYSAKLGGSRQNSILFLFLLHFIRPFH